MNVKHWLSTNMWTAFFVLFVQGCGVLHEPAFKGQILDYETKQPIKGAAVVATYRCNTTTIIAGDATAVVAVKEVVTDNSGRFILPSFSSVIYPISRGADISFEVFKPGYYPVDHLSIGSCFTGKCERQEVWSSPPRDLPAPLPDYVISEGKVELTKIVSERERRLLIPSGVYLHKEKTPHLMKLIRAARDRFDIH